jgi:hypothetical protein
MVEKCGEQQIETQIQESIEAGILAVEYHMHEEQISRTNIPYAPAWMLDDAHITPGTSQLVCENMCPTPAPCSDMLQFAI